MTTARHVNVISGNQDHFIATANVSRLDDNPAIYQWKIDDKGFITAVLDDTVKRRKIAIANAR